MDPGPLAHLPLTTRLSHSGLLAELARDELTETSVVLRIGGVEQSCVDSDDPGWLLHDYTVRIAAILQALSEPTTLLHLGAGALTLPRWVEHQAQRQHQPPPVQTVLDIEPELMDFVLTALPMSTRPETIVADAAAALAPGGLMHGRVHDVVVVDLFNSADAPDSLTSAVFCDHLRHAGAAGGLLVVNLGDEPDLRFARAQVSRLVDHAASGAWDRCLLTARADVLGGTTEGNLVFAALGRDIPDSALDAIWAAGPHPGEVLTSEELRQWTRTDSQDE